MENRLKPTNFIYPTESFRKYQYDIAKTCCRRNTLVCIPTGMGKTFIASVVMRNFFAWLRGKIFFFAHTKPLVNQQMDSFLTMFPECESYVCELTGSIPRHERSHLYSQYRIFFMTPQTLQNDINREEFPFEINLLIFDEAHKAQKDYAYCKIVDCLYSTALSIRIIGLTASPGGKLSKVQDLVDNLHINEIELRADNDPEIKDFRNETTVIPVVVDVNKDMEKYKKCLENLIKARFEVLTKQGLMDKCSSKYLGVKKIVDKHREFSQKKDDYYCKMSSEMISEMHSSFNLLNRLVQARKALNDHGISVFKQKMIDLEDPPKTPLKSNYKSKAKSNLLASEDFKTIKKGINSSEKKNSEERGIHPKLVKLLEIIKGHRLELQSTSQAIIFTSLKDSVAEIVEFLNSSLFGQIEAVQFLGQGKNFSKKHQMHTIDRFRRGEIRLLVSTSVGEEGLDIGEVDIIVCYDVASTNPVRTIQRFGRTGRKRDGKVYVFMGKGEETGKFYACKRNLKNVSKELKAAASGRLNLDKATFRIDLSAAESEEVVEKIEMNEKPVLPPKRGKSDGKNMSIMSFFGKNRVESQTEVKPIKKGFEFTISKQKTKSGNKFQSALVKQTAKKKVTAKNPFLEEELDLEDIEDLLEEDSPLRREDSQLETNKYLPTLKQESSVRALNTNPAKQEDTTQPVSKDTDTKESVSDLLEELNELGYLN